MPDMPIGALTLRHDGIWDFTGLYRMIWGWLQKQGYRVFERRYKDKTTDSGNEVDIEWECDKKVTEYYRFYFNVTWKAWSMNEVEITLNGKKEKRYQGRVRIVFDSFIRYDYQNRLRSDNPIIKIVAKVYDEVITKGERELNYADQLEIEMFDIMSRSKQFLEMEVD